MTVNLCLDWGNTRVKAGIWDKNGKLTEKINVHPDEAVSALDSLISRHQPEAAMLCSVSGNHQAAEELLRERIRYFYILGTDTRLPIMNAYHSPQTLGADRLALVSGAYAQFPDRNTLVISLGTCITYNLIQKSKAFRGGAISPGLRMRLQSMHAYTDRLPLATPEGEVLLLGYDTDTSLRSGAVNGIVFEIEGMIQAYSAQYPDFNAVLTGGDISFFERKLKSRIFADPDLSLRGLNLILNHNVPQIR